MYCPKSEQLVRLWRAKFHNLRLCDDFFWWGKGGVACQFCWMKGKICTLRKEYLPLLSQIFGKVRCCFQVKSEEMERNLDQHWEDWSAIFHCFHIGKGTMKKFWNLFSVQSTSEMNLFRGCLAAWSAKIGMERKKIAHQSDPFLDLFAIWTLNLIPKSIELWENVTQKRRIYAGFWTLFKLTCIKSVEVSWQKWGGVLGSRSWSLVKRVKVVATFFIR